MEELKNIEKAINDFFKECKEKQDTCEVEKRGCEGCYYDK